jgi:histidinol-phosphate phosphatase family protein
MILKDLHIDASWSLFLDRDGVINKKLPGDYVKNWDEFEFLEGVTDAVARLTELFGKIFVATNQQGIGKGIMTEMDLDKVHDQMMHEIRYAGGRIDKVYHSPYREDEKSVFRKPNVGMARKAKIDFPEIELNKSIMVGDSRSDLEFGKNSGMVTVLISDQKKPPEDMASLADFVFPNLHTFADEVAKNEK